MGARKEPPVGYRPCKDCGRYFKKEELSSSGLCTECYLKHIFENVKNLREKKGPYYERWRAGIISFYNKLIEESKTKEVKNHRSTKRGKVRK